jgi:hypothetical protein
MRIHALAPVAALVLALGSAACTADTVDRDTTTVAGGNVDTGMGMALRVAEVELGKGLDTADMSVRDETDDFGVNDTISVAVKTSGRASDARLTARWTFQDGQLVREDHRTLSPTGDAWTIFQVSKESPWPKGNYKVAILLNGNQVESKDFEVK